jgi:hypothetical protein
LTLAEAWAKRDAAGLLERWMRYLPGVLAAGTGAVGAQLPTQAGDAIWAFYQRLARARGLLRGTTNPNVRLLFESLLLEWRDLAVAL